MHKDTHDRIVVNHEEIFDLLYSGKITDLRHLCTESCEDIDLYIKSVKLNNDNFSLPQLTSDNPIDYKQTWLIPKKYQEFNIALWLFEQCQTSVEIDRVAKELELYIKFDLIPVLNCIKYLVDVMRQHNIVWGVGRGSSVASYCLYLIGLHKIDSIKYDLDIKEFFKEAENDEKSL